MNFTAADNRWWHGAWVRGQLINSTWWGTVISFTTLTPSSQRLIWPRTQAPCHHRLSAAVKFISYRGIEADNAHFQPSAWEFLTTKQSRRFANDVALALGENIAAGMDFQVANRLWADNGRNLSVQPWLRLRTLKTLKTQNSRNGVISSKRHKNTPEVSNFYSFYWINVKLSVF